MKKIVSAALFSLVVFSVYSQSTYFPDTVWQVKKPENNAKKTIRKLSDEEPGKV